LIQDWHQRAARRVKKLTAIRSFPAALVQRPHRLASANVLVGPGFPPGQECQYRWQRTPRTSKRCCGTLRTQVALAHGHEWFFKTHHYRPVAHALSVLSRLSVAASDCGPARRKLELTDGQTSPAARLGSPGGKSFSEWMDDHPPTYESEPRRSVTQWIKSQPLYDRLYAAYQDTRWSARETSLSSASTTST
jgi:hypothetical protein